MHYDKLYTKTLELYMTSDEYASGISETDTIPMIIMKVHCNQVVTISSSISKGHFHCCLSPSRHHIWRGEVPHFVFRASEIKIRNLYGHPLKYLILLWWDYRETKYTKCTCSTTQDWYDRCQKIYIMICINKDIK